jgi:hypothetical protein
MSQPYFPFGRWVSRWTLRFPLVEIFLPQIGHTNLMLFPLVTEGLVLVCSTPRDEYTGDCLKQEHFIVLSVNYGAVLVGTATDTTAAHWRWLFSDSLHHMPRGTAFEWHKWTVSGPDGGDLSDVKLQTVHKVMVRWVQEWLNWAGCHLWSLYYYWCNKIKKRFVSQHAFNTRGKEVVHLLV